MSTWTTDAPDRAVFGALALVHALPAAGVLGRSLLERAYGIDVSQPDLLVLLQHRALLFGLLGGACAAAAWNPLWRWPVAWMALASMLGFVALAALHPHSSAIARVAWVDGATTLVLLGWMGWACRRG
ncbi:MAG: phosphopantetheine adenylyltransferase [Rhodoferax sp.]